MKTPDLTTSNQLGASCYERVRTALSYLNPYDRDLWVKYGTCIKAEFGDAGFDLWNEWGMQAESHKASSASSTWKSFKEAGKMQIGTLFYDARGAGWKDDSKYTKPTKEQIDARNAANAAHRAQAEAKEAVIREAAALRSREVWDASADAGEHPYLEKKGVQAHGLRVGVWERIDPDTDEVEVLCSNALLVPICDVMKKIHSLQGIFPDGTKSYLAGGAKRGHMHFIGSKPLQRDGKNIFVLVEGYATGASVHECTGHMVIVCFDTGGLLPVAKLLRERQPDAIIILAADNDAQTEGNPGVRAARKAALEVGGLVAMPPPGDLNDLHQAEGPDAVIQCIEIGLQGANEKPVQADPHYSSALPSNTSVLPPQTRNEERRLQQQEENCNLQAEKGAMVPSALNVEEMIEHCVWIAEGKQVGYVTDDRSMFMKYDAFQALTSPSKTDVESSGRGSREVKSVPTAVLWQADPRRKSAMTATFHPGKEIFTVNPAGLRAVNTWRPIFRGPMKVKVQPFLDQVDYLFPESTERNVYLDWLAHIEQKPGELPHYGWLHIAQNTGTGRNWMASVLARVFRGYVAPNVDLPALLDSPFNGELSGRILAIVDEVQEGGAEGSYRHAERLKSMINAETRTVNHKYGMKYTEFNACRWLIFSNHKNALPINDEDRRFRVVMHDAQPRSPDLYERLYELLADPEFINAVGVYLRERDISRFKPGERPPLNEAKRAAIAASKPMSTQIAELIATNWPADIITNKNIVELITGDPAKKDFSAGMRRAMEDVGAVAWARGSICRLKVNGDPQRLWILRNHAKWLGEDTAEIRDEEHSAGVSINRSAAMVLAEASDPNGTPL